jgi:flavin-dependent dehydrogenase
LADEPWARWSTARPARLGFATTVVSAVVPAGVLMMCVGGAGYVGLVRLADGRTHVGAALWPEACHARHGPQGVIQQILAQCRQPAIAELAEARFLGTGPLTVRRAMVAGPRVLAVGDACGYVEPFTGEGISWAIRGAVAAAGVLPERAGDWHDGLMGAWQERFETVVRQRQRWCGRLRGVLGRPLLAAGCVALARYWPGMPARVAQRICA